MSRIGRMPIELPAGVAVTVADGNVVTVKGKLGELTERFSPRMTIAVEGNTVLVSRPTDEKQDKSLHGLTRALLHNMVVGVTEGFSKKLEIVGVGYKVVKQGIIRITLKYLSGRQKVIRGIRRVSKPGLRIYASCEDMPSVMNGLGIAIVSTSKGIMTGKKARALNVGGEVLAFVW